MEDERKINHTLLRLIKDDITDRKTGALVYYASPDLDLGSGFGTGIAGRGGRSIQEELKDLAPVSVGEAVISSAGNLKADYIIHAVGPRFQEEDTEGKLRTTMKNILKLAEEKGIKSLLFPPMGTGFYGVPMDLSARVMKETITEHLENSTGLEEVVICLIDSWEYKAFKTGFQF